MRDGEMVQGSDVGDYKVKMGADCGRDGFVSLRPFCKFVLCCFLLLVGELMRWVTRLLCFSSGCLQARARRDGAGLRRREPQQIAGVAGAQECAVWEREQRQRGSQGSLRENPRPCSSS